MSKSVKRMMLDSFGSVVCRRPDFLVVDASKVSGVAMNRLRLDFAEIRLHVLGVKNAIASKVLADAGVCGADVVFSGPSAVVFGDVDVVELSKRVCQCAELNKSIVVRGGVVDGRVICEAEVVSLSRSPGRLELLSSISSSLLSSGSRVASSIKSVGTKIASQIDAIGA